MAMSIYDIDAAIMNCIDIETGEVIDEEALKNLEMEREKKIENVACWLKNLKAEAEAIKAEKLALQERQRIAENKVESLKKYLLFALNGEKFSTGKVNISYRKSSSVEVDDIHALENGDYDEFLKYKEPEADKNKIKEAIKNGQSLPGCTLVEKTSIQIK